MSSRWKGNSGRYFFVIGLGRARRPPIRVRRLIKAGQRHDLGILYGPLVSGRAGKRHCRSFYRHCIGDPIRPRHKAGVLGTRRFHGQGPALHLVRSATCRKLLYIGVDYLLGVIVVQLSVERGLSPSMRMTLK